MASTAQAHVARQSSGQNRVSTSTTQVAAMIGAARSLDGLATSAATSSTQQQAAQQEAPESDTCTESPRTSALYKHICTLAVRFLKLVAIVAAFLSTLVLAVLLTPVFCGIPAAAAAVFTPCDLALGVGSTVWRSHKQGFMRCTWSVFRCLVVVAVWPAEVLLCHMGMILHMTMVSICKGDPVSLCKLVAERTYRFLQLAACSLTGKFEQKWKVMECHSACAMATLWHFVIVGLGMILIAAIRFVHCLAAGVRQACDVMSDWHNVLRSFTDVRADEEVPTTTAVLLWMVTLPFALPVAVMYASFLCTIIGLQLALGGTLAFVCTLLGGALYVADTCYKYMTLDSTTGAMYVNVQAFDDFTTRLMRPFVSALTVPDDLEYPILEELQEPNPYFLNEFAPPDANGNHRPVQLPYLLNVANMFLSECRDLTKQLLDDHWLTMNDLASAEPFLFIGLPGITLLRILQRTKKLDTKGQYDGYLYFIPCNELDASLLLVSGAWSEVKTHLMEAHTLIHSHPLTPQEQTYLEAWISLVGDEERLPVLGTHLATPSPASKAHLLKISSAVQTVAIAVSRMPWFQQQFTNAVTKQLLRMSAVQSSEPSRATSTTVATHHVSLDIAAPSSTADAVVPPLAEVMPAGREILPVASSLNAAPARLPQLVAQPAPPPPPPPLPPPPSPPAPSATTASSGPDGQTSSPHKLVAVSASSMTSCGSMTSPALPPLMSQTVEA